MGVKALNHNLSKVLTEREQNLRVKVNKPILRRKQIKQSKAAFTRQMLANSCWKIQISVCERHNNMFAICWRKVGEKRNKLYFLPTVCQHVVVSFTHTNLRLPTRVGQH